jgi:glucuronosyltransferase
MGINMDILSVTKDTLLNAILEIVNNNRWVILKCKINIHYCTYVYWRYKKNAKIASKRFNDRPMSPTKSVVYWTEYVLRYKGALHLKSHALNLKWYQYFLVDVISTFLFIVFIILFIIYYSLKMICKHFYIFVKDKRE